MKHKAFNRVLLKLHTHLRRLPAAFLIGVSITVSQPVFAHAIPEWAIKNAIWDCETAWLPVSCEIAGEELIQNEPDHTIEDRRFGFELLQIGCTLGRPASCHWVATLYQDEPDITDCWNDKKQAQKHSAILQGKRCAKGYGGCSRFVRALYAGYDIPRIPALEIWALQRDCHHLESWACEAVALKAKKKGDLKQQYAYGVLSCLRKGNKSQGCLAGKEAKKRLLQQAPAKQMAKHG